MNENYIWKDNQLKINPKLLAIFGAPLLVWYVGLGFYLASGNISIFNYNNDFLMKIDGVASFICAFAGLLISSALIAFFPKLTAWMTRIALPLALLCTIALLFPFSANVAVLIIYAIVFLSAFIFNTSASFACHSFTAQTAWISSLMGVVIGGFTLALLRNNIVTIGFDLFLIMSVFLLAVATGFFYLVPAEIKVPMASKRDRVKLPEITFYTLLILLTSSTYTSAYAISFASKSVHGLTFLFGGAAIFALLALGLWSVMKSNTIKLFSICFFMLLVGMILAFISFTQPKYYLTACVMLSISIVASGCFIALLATAFSMFPTRYIAIIGTLVFTLSLAFGFGVQIIFANIPVMLLFFNNIAALSMSALYFIMIKYLVYAFESHTLGTNIRLVGLPFSMPHKVQTSREKHPFDVLTKEELMIVKLLLEGHTDHSIAKNMSIEDETELTYRDSLFQKLRIRSKLALFKIVDKQPYEF